MEEARKLARFINELTYDDLPLAAIGKAKELILDQLGCQLSGSTLPWSRAVYKYVRDNKAGRQESTVVNYGFRTLAQDAAYANATFGHGFEADDTDSVSSSHLGCVIIAAALAAAEREVMGGKEFVKAVVVGYDVALRIAAAARLAIRRGFVPTSVFGTFGAAAATSAMLHLSEDETANALSLAASHSSGLTEYQDAGGSVSRLHAGIAAYGGMSAAFLAQRGLTGPSTILEGNKGFCQAFSDERFLEEISAGLGKEFKLMRVGLKPYCCCGTQHSTIDAISKIASEHIINPGEIADINIAAPESVLHHAAAIVEPEDITGAQFSGRFGVAVRLLKGGNGFRQYTEDNLTDPEILSLIHKTRYTADDDLAKSSKAKSPVKVTIRMADGTVYEQSVVFAKGTIRNPMTKEEADNKFRELSSVVLPQQRVEEIFEAVAGLEKLDNIQKLISLLIAG